MGRKKYRVDENGTFVGSFIPNYSGKSFDEHKPEEVDDPNLRYKHLGRFNPDAYYNKIRKEIGNDDCIVPPGFDFKYGECD